MSYILLMKYQVEYTNPASQHSWLLQREQENQTVKTKKAPLREGPNYNIFMAIFQIYML